MAHLASLAASAASSCQLHHIARTASFVLSELENKLNLTFLSDPYPRSPRRTMIIVEEYFSQHWLGLPSLVPPSPRLSPGCYPPDPSKQQVWSLGALTCLSLISFGARNTVRGLSCLTVDKHGNSLEAEDASPKTGQPICSYSDGPSYKSSADGRLEIFPGDSDEFYPMKLEGVTSEEKNHQILLPRSGSHDLTIWAWKTYCHLVIVSTSPSLKNYKLKDHPLTLQKDSGNSSMSLDVCYVRFASASTSDAFPDYGGRSTSSSREGIARTSRTFTEFAKGVAWSKVLAALK
ncbi:hypothetical protein DFH08DRAFT_808211 [Mycena albidolilacea]|uniref:Uncharacterized protein n=1 Tax=Mycena albidolilacea TaxID=1033008 RepID=A0AAD7ESE5_9AGAR|nr:hypothetical protein DFH08DRAFT_808211 [Mycena albidolilacea]